MDRYVITIQYRLQSIVFFIIVTSRFIYKKKLFRTGHSFKEPPSGYFPSTPDDFSYYYEAYDLGENHDFGAVRKIFAYIHIISHSHHASRVHNKGLVKPHVIDTTNMYHAGFIGCRL